MYIYIYYIIIPILYIILYYSLPLQYSSPHLPSSFPIYLIFCSPTLLLIYSSPSIISFPSSIPHSLPIFILYVSVLTYAYLYSITIIPRLIFNLLFHASHTHPIFCSSSISKTDPACFIGVDG
jgi:hypothetical protein